MQVYQAENQHDRAGRRGDADLLASGESGDQVTAGSIHVASAGRNWQTVACGFAGFRVRNGQMILDMHPAWLEHRRLPAQLAGNAMLMSRITPARCSPSSRPGDGPSDQIWDDSRPGGGTTSMILALSALGMTADSAGARLSRRLSPAPGLDCYRSGALLPGSV